MYWWIGAGLAALLAVLTGLADRRRVRRDDLDRISWIDWRTAQMFALIAAVGCAIVAQHG